MEKRRNASMNAIIFGPPGSGKGTYASRLQSMLGVAVIAMGDVFREMLKEDTPLGRKVKGYVENGLLVPDDIVIDVLKQHLAEVPKDRGFILDGYPRTTDQAEVLEGIVDIDVILLQIVPDWIIIERLSSRRICGICGAVYNIRYLKPKVDGVCDTCSGPLYQRSDDKPEVIKRRIHVYQEQTSPILEYYRDKEVPFVISRITALETKPETVVEQIIEELRKLNLA